jgi:hypothetical protein
MNPDTTIRPWLVACGKYWGANDAFEFRLSDESTRKEFEYFTYQKIRIVPNQDGRQRKNRLSGSYDAYRSAEQEWTVTFKIELFNSQDGMNELAACCIAAIDETDIRAIFSTRGCAFKRCLSINDNSEWNDERVYYRHTMMCEFNAWLRYEHFKINDVIEEVDISDAFSIT